MEFEESVNQIATKIQEQKDIIETEEATKNAFILPFIGQVLGYDVFNPKEVIPEFTADVGLKKGEKVDYALVHDDQVQILVECKKIGCPLSIDNASQLFRYFAATKARIGVLTNGQVWNFYMDIDQPNIMDSKPFLILDLMDIDPAMLPALEKLTKPDFDIDSIASSAEELKYVGSLKRAIGDEFKQPSSDFVKLLTRHVYEGRFGSSVREKFEPLVGKALKQFLSEQVNDRLKTALGADDVKPMIPVQSSDVGEQEQTTNNDEASVEEQSKSEKGVVTTDEEWEAYFIVKAIACANVDPTRITMRDAKEYCAIFLDDNNRKPVVRLYFNREQKYIGLFDECKHCNRMAINKVDDIYSFADQIREEVNRLL